MKAKQISGLLIIITFVVWVIWDLFAYTYGANSTISVVITDFSYYSPAFPAIAGALVSHFFWPAKRSID